MAFDSTAQTMEEKTEGSLSKATHLGVVESGPVLGSVDDEKDGSQLCEERPMVLITQVREKTLEVTCT